MKAKKGQHVDSIYGHDDPITGRRVCTECFNLDHHPHRDVMTAEQWASLTAVERSAVAGAIAGNFAAHHPAECFDLLRECVRLKDGVA